MTYFHFIRHGDAYDIRGFQKFDSNLNEFGEAQAKYLQEVLNDECFDHIVVSPLTRARETANISTKNLNQELVTMGSLAEIGNDYFWPNPLQVFGVTSEELDKELASSKVYVDNAWQNLKNSYTGKVLVFTHGNWIRVLLAILLNLDNSGFQRFKIDYASVTTIEIDEDGHETVLGVSCTPGTVVKKLTQRGII